MKTKTEYRLDARMAVQERENGVPAWEIVAGAFAIAIFGVLTMAVWVVVGIK